jgi:hypothetical protein
MGEKNKARIERGEYRLRHNTEIPNLVQLLRCVQRACLGDDSAITEFARLHSNPRQTTDSIRRLIFDGYIIQDPKDNDRVILTTKGQSAIRAQPTPDTIYARNDGQHYHCNLNCQMVKEPVDGMNYIQFITSTDVVLRNLQPCASCCAAAHNTQAWTIIPNTLDNFITALLAISAKKKTMLKDMDQFKTYGQFWKGQKITAYTYRAVFTPLWLVHKFIFRKEIKFNA